MMQRRSLLQAGLGLGVTGGLLPGPARALGRVASQVVVIGGGFAGATAAKYLREWSMQRVEVTLVEPQSRFLSCPLSNLVLAGERELADLTLGYDALVNRHGVRWVREAATGIDPQRRRVRLPGGAELPYDRLIVAPGVGFDYREMPGMNQPGAQESVLHGWKAGAQTLALRRQLQAMPDGGVFAISIPPVPYRCPPGPYERACLVAQYLGRHKPRSKVLILDANPDVTSKGALFKQVWAERYPGLVEYRPGHRVIDVDPARQTFKLDFHEDVRADVLNLIPPMRAGQFALDAGLATAEQRWCQVDFLSFESRAVERVHVLGDAVQSAPASPKSAHMANQHGKTCAAAVLALLSGEAVNPLPLYHNTCYSFVSGQEAVHVASVHRYDAARATMLPVAGAGGLSEQPSAIEGAHALAWARGIWADTLA
jgi:NADPH-dependent 2,4-dienoyl-CoA reductase/sulfur reductase-like enzyme